MLHSQNLRSLFTHTTARPHLRNPWVWQGVVIKYFILVGRQRLIATLQASPKPLNDDIVCKNDSIVQGRQLLFQKVLKVAKYRDCAEGKSFAHKCSGNRVVAKHKMACTAGVIIILSIFLIRWVEMGSHFGKQQKCAWECGKPYNKRWSYG